MILSPAIAEKAAILANTDDSLLPLFPVMERAVILSLKELMRNENEAASNIEGCKPAATQT